MNLARLRNLREQLRPRFRRRRKRSEREREPSVLEDIAGEFTTAELQEFLEADLYPVEHDPAFKESLRQELWAVVQKQRKEGAEE